MMRILLTAICLVLLFPNGALRAGEAPPGGMLILSVREAVLMSLDRNRAFLVRRYAPAIARTGEDQAAAAFDTELAAGLTGTWERTPASGDGEYERQDRQRLSLGAEHAFATGTTMGVDLEIDRTQDPAAASSRLGLSLTQALLQGRGREANLATLRQRRLDTALSVQELRGYAVNLVAEVEEACWDYLLAGRRIAIVERSLGLAEAQLSEVRERISVGRVAEIEAAAAEAEAAARREALINARSTLALARLRILSLLNPEGPDFLEREVRITDIPALPEADPDPLASHVALARRQRADLNEARLRLEQGELEVVRTRNGLLPKLDFFLSLGKTGYADAVGESLDWGGKGYDAQAGLTLRFPWPNRAADAAARRALLSREQAAEAVTNLAELVELDVRRAWIELQRLREQTAATAVSLRLQEEKLRAETEKFRVGKSTTFLVAQAQRDLLQAEIDSEAAVTEYLKALVELYRLEDSLLERRGLALEN